MATVKYLSEISEKNAVIFVERKIQALKLRGKAWLDVTVVVRF